MPQMEVRRQSGSKEQGIDPYRTARDVFDLVKQFETPPFPNTYALWYAYASKSNEGIVQSVEAYSRNGRSISPYDINQLCEKHLTPNDIEARQEEITKQFSEEIAQVITMINEGVENGHLFASRLDEIAKDLSDTDEVPERIIASLIQENRRMAYLARQLNAGLKDACDQVQELNCELEVIRKDRMCDALTGLANRRAFDDSLNRAMEQADYEKSSLCLALMDLDHFKNINDLYGHQSGDAVLKAVSDILKNYVKARDTVARYGGEEFAVILPHTNVTDAHNLMTRIRQILQKSEIDIHPNNLPISGVTASFGISRFHSGDTQFSIIQRADEGLYAAKSAGRNRVVTEGLIE